MIQSVRQHPLLLLIAVLLVLSWHHPSAVHAQGGTDFQGTVLTTDAAAGKLVVKKEEGGTRFTFVVNDKTQFTGSGLKNVSDIKKGDHVVINYTVSGTQYIAQKVTAVSKK